ncbi:hypothetical protein DPEC_G00315850 [Dallia pectoralis]|uniref:Uncharacterized protein n=1 Tax=Dallia pectoralis TaxID=75939 RepID=A0ACC2FCM8_DALPE|nr:hypothetical protein DPEC_G00315850 [Dallia pectoralis]
MLPPNSTGWEMYRRCVVSALSTTGGEVIPATMFNYARYGHTADVLVSMSPAPRPTTSPLHITTRPPVPPASGRVHGPATRSRWEPRDLNQLPGSSVAKRQWHAEMTAAVVFVGEAKTIARFTTGWRASPLRGPGLL